ncbi:PHP domain-containing protein [Saccharicrinis sp. FJH54]|uniref:PHP domain-containing protein n=1 Tax=Saccharicrinis sp. FJH54 TaxID=3344665 RepID=UPI0035D4562E
MKTLRIDLHIHSVLSPCGELEMSPANIISEAQVRGLDIIAITDHNSTRQAGVIREMGKQIGIKVLYGAEVTTREDVHVLCLFQNREQAGEFQVYLDKHLPDIKNKEHLFGFQVAVDAEEHIIHNEKRLLLSAIDQSIEDVETKVHSLGGLFIPAHVDRQAYGLYAQLGIMPQGLKVDALEFSYNMKDNVLKRKYPESADHVLLTFSDAHRVNDIGRAVTLIKAKKPTFRELKKALRNEKGRHVIGFEYEDEQVGFQV